MQFQQFNISVQKLRNSSKIKEPLDSAILYYSLLATLHGINLTKRQIELIAFIAVKGSLSSRSSRLEFCERFGSSTSSVNNMVRLLKKQQFLIRDGNRIKVNPQIALDFTSNIWLQIKLEHSVDG